MKKKLWWGVIAQRSTEFVAQWQWPYNLSHLSHKRFLSFLQRLRSKLPASSPCAWPVFSPTYVSASAELSQHVWIKGNFYNTIPFTKRPCHILAGKRPSKSSESIGQGLLRSEDGLRMFKELLNSWTQLHLPHSCHSSMFTDWGCNSAAEFSHMGTCMVTSR